MTQKTFKALYGSPDRPLRLGDREIPCYVLDDDTRVLAMTGMLKAMNMSLGGTGKPGKDRLTKFINTKGIKPFISNDLMARTTRPIKFKPPHGGGVAYGYEATILV